MDSFKSRIEIVTSSKAKLAFVKVPDLLNDIEIDNTAHRLSGNLLINGLFRSWGVSPLPDNCTFVGYSHNLEREEIETIFSSFVEFYQTCYRHEILYNYSAYTGKWAVLSIANE